MTPQQTPKTHSMWVNRVTEPFRTVVGSLWLKLWTHREPAIRYDRDQHTIVYDRRTDNSERQASLAAGVAAGSTLAIPLYGVLAVHLTGTGSPAVNAALALTALFTLAIIHHVFSVEFRDGVVLTGSTRGENSHDGGDE